MKIHDPYASVSLDLDECLLLEDTDDGFTPVASTLPGHWFALDYRSGATFKLDELPESACSRVMERTTENAVLDGIQYYALSDTALETPTITEAFLSEGVQDEHTLKAIFLAGAGGAGKSKVADAMFAGTGLKVINADAHLERLMHAAGKPLKDVGGEYGMFRDARDLRNLEIKKYGRLRLGLIVDSTGWAFNRIDKPVQRFKALGYDCYMVFVTTALKTALNRNKARGDVGGRRIPSSFVDDAWTGAHKNIEKYRQLFGAKNFFLIDNDKDLDDKTWTSLIAPAVRKVANKILRRPLKNAKGKKWLVKARKGRGLPEGDVSAHSLVELFEGSYTKTDVPRQFRVAFELDAVGGDS